MKKTLNVRRITSVELAEKWGFMPPWGPNKIVFIRCDAKGNINWDKAPVYFETELQNRSVVEIADPESD